MIKFLTLCCFLFSVGLNGQKISLPEAEKLYYNAQFEDSVKILELLSAKGDDSSDDYLLGKSYFMLGDFNKASEHFQKLIDSKSGKWPYPGAAHHWLGRSHGKRAEYSNVLFAYKYAVKAKRELEKAAGFCPDCTDVQLDLFEYYLEAPSFLGGGRTKAEVLAAKIFNLNPTLGYKAKSELAEQNKNYNIAEEYLIRAIEAGTDKWWVYVDMATFLARRGRFRESEVFFDKAEKIWPDNPQLLFEKAQVYIISGQRHDQAVRLLEAYLKSNPLFDYSLSRFEARKMLKKLKFKGKK